LFAFASFRALRLFAHHCTHLSWMHDTCWAHNGAHRQQQHFSSPSIALGCLLDCSTSFAVVLIIHAFSLSQSLLRQRRRPIRQMTRKP
jgi:hypothetical protein